MLRYNTAMGILYLVATPIGNLEDITHRALRVLSEVALIAAEDTRHTRKLLSHYNIQTPTISYHEFSDAKQHTRIMKNLAQSDVALVSDAGTPGLSDPGFELVKLAIEAGYQVSPIPGPSAPIAALVASGLATDTFIFLGYLPRKSRARRTMLGSLVDENRTMICFEVPHRLRDTLDDIVGEFGPDRQLAVCRELSKLHEQIQRDRAEEIRQAYQGIQPRGEFTLVLAGAPAAKRWTEKEVRQAYEQSINEGQSPSQAAREIAAQAGWPRQEVYRLGLEEE